MTFDNPALWVVGGVMLVLLLFTAGTHFFSSEARLQRRRRKNNSRVVNTARRPTVKFSVRTEDKKSKRR